MTIRVAWPYVIALGIAATFCPHLMAADGTEVASESVDASVSPNSLETIKVAGGTVVTLDFKTESESEHTSVKGYVVYLKDAVVSDNVIEAIASLNNLIGLGLYESGITEQQFLRLPNLQKLSYLTMNGSQVTDAVIDQICKCRELGFLLLDSINVSDDCLCKIEDLTKLQTLELNQSLLGPKTIKAVGELLRLQTLRLSNAKYDPTALQALGNLKDLEELNLENSQSCSGHLQFLRSLLHLQKLDLSQPEISDDDLNDISDMKELQNIHLWDNTSITDAGLSKLGKLLKLTDVALGSQSVSDEGLIQLVANLRLTHLGLAETKISERGLSELARTSSDLEELTIIGQGQITHIGLENLKSFTKLRVLKLADMSITDKELVAIAQLKGLTKLYLKGTLANEESLTVLLPLTNLQELCLDSCKMSEQELWALAAGIPSIKWLDLTNTNVSDRMVAQIQAARPEIKISR